MIEILLFAELEEIVGERKLTDPQLVGKTINEVREKLKQDYPNIKQIDRAMVAVNEEYAEDDQQLNEGDVVAFIPPVSGG
ncbi:molybdopterin converting factor subunit 1 [Texcoconibacillus texcoconensis]|uniref:Molybdopterin synthase sulfur carrier subunit n=1 Tax=Texcoconibacillus texcoconensis TaxID=1095777 RepID=A0A840QSN1_9BACI|nr:molybdopterin converting factor subunit 1 [Texcoconibacillus texcoconensis]MBB5174318.1 molybdopterin synthase sulfur carrier subunit [Texcoconibacillus texcoconensis]